MMSFDVLAQALGNVLQFGVLMAILLGAAYGLFVGALPGLTATMATALLVPLTFYLDPLPAVALIVSSTAMAITAGGYSGGAVADSGHARLRCLY